MRSLNNVIQKWKSKSHFSQTQQSSHVLAILQQHNKLLGSGTNHKDWHHKNHNGTFIKLIGQG